jgi:hypothetical protein
MKTLIPLEVELYRFGETGMYIIPVADGYVLARRSNAGYWYNSRHQKHYTSDEWEVISHHRSRKAARHAALHV